MLKMDCEIKFNVSFEARALLDPIISKKMKEMNLTEEDEKEMTENWGRMEMRNFLEELIPRSFRDGRKQFDDCVQTGRHI